MIRRLSVLFTMASAATSFQSTPTSYLIRATADAATTIVARRTKTLHHVEQRHNSPHRHLSTTTLGGNSQDNSEVSSSAQPSRKSLVATVGVSALLCVSVAAKVGLLQGLPVGDGLPAQPYTDALILRDIASTFLTATLGYLFVYINTYAVSRDWLDPRDARKLIHTLSAPLFIITWPIFSPAIGARVYAAIVPSMNALRLYLASRGGSETKLARAVSRSGDANEALGGPFIYVIILATCILAFWRSSAVGIVALSALAAGDGVADLVGRRFGKTNKWLNSENSVAGSLAFWLASTACATGLLLWLQYWGCLTLTLALPELVLRLGGICFVAAALELAPNNLLDDNYSVPISAGLLTALFVQ